MEFVTTKLENAEIKYNLDEKFPTYFKAWNKNELKISENGTHFGYIFSGTCTLNINDEKYTLSTGMYFSIPSNFSIKGEGTGYIITRKDVHGLFYIGGKIEQTGRLKYIDGCSDTLLIPPVLFGFPCLNLLHIPANINQTAHTHSSVRVGVVVSGKGVCKTIDKEHVLETGVIFVLPTDGVHSFHTEDNELRIVAYHPDADFGPSDDDHPMINRTYVDGVSASQLDSIKTKEIVK